MTLTSVTFAQHHMEPHNTTPVALPHHTTPFALQDHTTPPYSLPSLLTFMACLRATPVWAHSTVMEEGRGLSNMRANDGFTCTVKGVQ